MNRVRLVVRDAAREIHAVTDEALADAVLGALGDEPETIEELDIAMERYHVRTGGSFLADFQPGRCLEPVDAGLMLVDLAARLLVFAADYGVFPEHYGGILYFDGEKWSDECVPFRLPKDWQIVPTIDGWETKAEELRRQRAAETRLDWRKILYGRPLVEFLARGCWEAFRDQPPSSFEADQLPEDEPLDEWQCRDDHERQLVRQIHADWLLTERDDLAGRSPRHWLLAGRNNIDLALQDRANQWSTLGHCPPPLDPGSHAYRFAGAGTHEGVMYYDLVRHLLWTCRDLVSQRAAGDSAITAGDCVAQAAAELQAVRDAWLDGPQLEHHGLTPREIIEHERQRLPEGMSGHAAVVDHDCPLCQMMADLPGPMFWHLDGCNMDDEFAFSSCLTREEWEAEQREYEEFSRRMDEKQAERERLGVDKLLGDQESEAEEAGDGEKPTWTRSFVDESCGQSPVMRLYGIGTLLAELTVDLKYPPRKQPEAKHGEPAQEADCQPVASEVHRPFLDQLSRDFGNLREVCHSPDAATGAALIEPVLARFCDTLASVAAVRADLARKCDDLSDRLRHFLDPPRTPADLPETTDDDIPF